MKSIFGYVFTIVFALTITAIACTKANNSTDSKEHEKFYYRLGAVGGDTTFTPGRLARVETVGLLVAEDDKLKVELIGFSKSGTIGTYILKVTNKTDCQKILRWNYDDINPTSIQPNDSTANTDQSDVLKSNQVKIYTVIGRAVPGKIYVQGKQINNNCPNSSQLIINITMDLLPIKYYNYLVTYDNNGSVKLSIDIDDPSTIDYFIIQKQVGANWVNIGKQDCDKVRKHWEFVIWDEKK